MFKRGENLGVAIDMHSLIMLALRGVVGIIIGLKFEPLLTRACAAYDTITPVI